VFKYIVLYPEPDDSRPVCPITSLASLLLQDDVFKHIHTAKELFHPKHPPLTRLDAIQFQVHLLNRVERGVWVWPSVHMVCMATSSSYDDIFVVMWVLVILSELDLFDHGGAFGSLLIIPVGHWPFIPASGEVKANWAIEE
jgi:hypothetical protein